MLSVKQAGRYLLFPPFCQKGGGGDPELKSKNLNVSLWSMTKKAGTQVGVGDK